jgi:hypothetical protein
MGYIANTVARFIFAIVLKRAEIVIKYNLRANGAERRARVLIPPGYLPRGKESISEVLIVSMIAGVGYRAWFGLVILTDLII